MEDDKKIVNQQFLLGLFGGIAIVAVIGMIIMAVILVGNSKKDKSDQVAVNAGLQNQQQQAQTPPAQGPVTTPVTASGISTFEQKKDAVICKEGGKPVVYLFSTTWCPHCQWIKDTFDQTVKEYVDAGKIKAYHWEVDTGDNTLTTEKETQVPTNQMNVYNEFNPGGSIPTFVFGCKYFRIGNGYESQKDLAAEAKEIKAAINDLIK